MKVSTTIVFFALLLVLGITNITAQSGSACITPNKENARCISIYSCPVLYDAVSTTDPQIIQFLKQSQCGFSSTPLVCCGKQANYVTRTSFSDNGGAAAGNLLPPEDQCGVQINDKVLNGETAGLREFPWMALLRYRNASGFESNSCGGTLISDRYVITAAHCLIGAIRTFIGDLISVRLGEFNTQTAKDCVLTQGFNLCADDPVNVGVSGTIPHPQYDDTSRDRLFDIGLVRLQRSVTYSDYIRPICLPSPNERATVGNFLTVVGWGRTETGRYSPTKQKLLVPVVEPNRCAATFRTQRVTLRDSQLCAGGEKDKDSCKGDSGGPLLNLRNNGQYFIEGVVSFGATCGTEGWPGIYTRVSSYLSWIKQNLKP
ncbi:phenoloxidase-activating factor 1-like [Onthophagus taurus]|uniref:phenoloxidase-activating factor 1-like n=1 Tax=Onthophagus taurus TaxID=166361 RepID=UPI000C20303D|nr:serine protease 7-like [Onthophagus taurus]